jgi:hypothetical protein
LPAPPVISLDQLHCHVKFLSSYKASGPDGIPNVVLQKALEHIKEFLFSIYQAVIKLGIYVDDWREFTMVVLRKPGKPNYKVPKAHCPIVLLCTMAKVLTAIVAEDILYMVEKELLLCPVTMGKGQVG